VFNWNRSSLRVRIILLTGAFAALVCISMSILVIVSVRGREAVYARERVNETSERVVSLIGQGHLPAVLPYTDDEVIQVIDTHGRVVTSTQQLAGKPPMATFRPRPNQPPVDRTLCPPTGGKGCQFVTAFRVIQPGGDWVIYTAHPVIPWYGDSTLLVFLIATSLLMTTMMAAGASRAVAKTLAPVAAIRRKLAEITATDLDRRVPVPRNQHEIRLLAETANATLDRLECAYEQLRHFTSDASHDLRSPITAMRAQLEEALLYPDDTDWLQMTKAVLTGVERLQAIVTDLLALARLDAGAPLTRDSTDLAQLVGAELDRRAFEMKVVRDLCEGVYTDCDRLRITRLLTNLLDNAERHAASEINVVVRPEESTAVLEVIDDGAGIAAELREVVFKRFTRLDASRNRDAGGTGLGLAIARQIAEAHGGTLTIEDSERGARFVLRLARCCPTSGPATRAEAAWNGTSVSGASYWSRRQAR
jgi:signal transduction histidine kinase